MEGEDARAFLEHGCRSSVAIHGKILSFKWAKVQDFVPSQVAKGLRNGATRNLVLRRAPGTITEEKIKADLEHIDRLDVVEMKREGGDVYLSLNRVSVAMCEYFPGMHWNSGND